MPEIKYSSDTFAAFGEFISVFAYTESLLSVLLRLLMGMEDDRKARIMCEGLRGTDIIKKIKELHKLPERPDQEKLRLESMFKQFNLVSEMRHNLVHRWSAVAGDRLISSGSLTSKGGSNSFEFYIYDISILRAAISDLEMMCQEIRFIIHDVNPKHFGPLHEEPDFEYYSWQYKPVLLSNTDRKPLDTP
jgi:hypothetical protein